MKKLAKVVGYLIATILSLIGLVVVIDFLLFEDFITTIKSLDATLIVGLSLIVVTAVGWVVTNHLAKGREIASRHYRYKLKSYKLIINLIFRIMESIKGEDELLESEHEENAREVLKFKKAILLQGNMKIIHEWNKYEDESRYSTDIFFLPSRMEKIYRLIREDLGHKDPKLMQGELVGLSLNPDALKEFKNYLSVKNQCIRWIKKVAIKILK